MPGRKGEAGQSPALSRNCSSIELEKPGHPPESRSDNLREKGGGDMVARPGEHPPGYFDEGGCFFPHSPDLKGWGCFDAQGVRMSTAARTVVALTISLVLATMPSLRTLPAQATELAPGTEERLRAVDKALRWLDAEQNSDGGFGDPTSDAETTCRVVLAFAASYEEPNTVGDPGKLPLEYLATQVVSYTNTAEGTSRMILAVVAGNEDPRKFGGSDLISILGDYYDPSTGRYQSIASDGIAAQALAIMALEVSFETVPTSATTWLKNQQNIDGGWGASAGQTSDTEHTALSLQALVAVGEALASQPIADGVDYLRARQTANGGFSDSALASDSDAASTALAIQALLASGEDLLSPGWSRCLRTPFDALLDFQLGDGSYDSDLSLTGRAVPALMGRSLPLPGRRLAALKALEWLKTQQDTDGGFGNGGITADAVYAIARCGQDPDGPEWTQTDNGQERSALDALEEQTLDYIESAPGDQPAGELAKVIRAVQAAKEVGVGWADPANFAGRNLVNELLATYVPVTGRYHPSKLFSHDLAILALAEVGETIPPEAVTEIETDQNNDGGWSWAWDGASDVDSTGLTMQALTAGAGPSSPTVFANAADYLQDLQFADGGFPDLATRTETNCNSTALAIEGLLAIGTYRDEPLVFSTGGGGVASSWDAILAFQEQSGQESGSFAFSSSWPGSRLMATLDAIPALVSTYYPVYQPLSETNGTVAGAVSPRLTCGSGLEIVGPYSGDDDNDGSASLRYRVVGNDSWTELPDMHKGGLAYLELLDLDLGIEYEIEVTYDDPDGISGGNPQSFTVRMGKAYVPLALKSHNG